ncbi:unnamed protein product [Sphagnum troendelagicum]|uniref:Pentatricopeptide repeat-containing protein n=1 Tax=Sphagnum troendelagicum TaxID=128251 RepID=A0ABP0U9A3_9BRYO
MDLCHDASRISESLEGLKMKRESHRNSRGNGSATALEKGKQAHAYIVPNRFEADVSVRNALISMYSRCGSIADVCQVFDKMHTRDVVSYNVAAYADHRHGRKDMLSKGILKMHLRSKSSKLGMQRQCMEPDKVTLSCVLGAYISSIDLEEGKKLHAHVARSGVESNVHLENALTSIMGNEYSVELFQRMQQEGVNPDRISFVSVLNAFTTPTVLELGKFVQTHIIKQGLDSDVGDLPSWNKLITGVLSMVMPKKHSDLYVNCNMKVLWNSLVAGYALHVLGKPTLVLFKQMQIQGVKPDNDTFVAVLSACSHAGLVDEGYCHFLSITKDHGIVPMVQHHGCLVSLLGQAGCFKEAMEFITEMPCQPDAMLCGTLFPACRVDCEVQLAEHAAHDLLKLDPQKASVYELLSKVYAAAGRWDNVVKIQNLMKERAVRKEAGHSWIRVRNRMHTFVAEDISHFQTEIYAMLRDLHEQMKDADFVINTSFVLLGRGLAAAAAAARALFLLPQGNAGTQPLG